MADQLATGTYEVLRNRLRDAAGDLRERFKRLNAARSEVFGNIETRLLTTAHVSTEHNCIPRDLLTVGGRLLLGYNVQFGLKTDIAPEDVFSLYELDGETTHQKPLSELFDERFTRDFHELYRYYKNTTLSRFFRQGPLVYFVFQVGKTPSDIKAFKWAYEGDSLRYIDNRSDHEVRYPDQHGFRWVRSTREQHRAGLHPHISIGDLIFVECVGGDLTIKVEDNTNDPGGIYSEPVDNPDQTLDDAEIHYCVLGNLVLLRMRPYQEKQARHLVYCVKRRQVLRLDAIERACVLLPDDHGIIFPGGVVLQTGEYRLFDHGLTDVMYERTVAAPNGEDFLYVFTDPATGSYLHLRYNLIRQEVDTPFVCHGQTFFEDGRMLSFRSQEQAQKHHALQMWQTPFVGPNYQLQVATDSMLYKIGNRELVRGMAECQEVLQLIDKDESYEGLYLDLAKRATDLLDSYFWIDREETQRLSEPLKRIRDTANAAVEEYEKVVRVRRDTEKALRETEQASTAVLKAIQRGRFETVDDFVARLAELRMQRGHAIGLRELRYIDLEAVERIERELVEAADRLGHRCVQFLLDPKALEPYRARVHEAEQRIGKVSSAADGRKLQDELAVIAGDLELLIETVSQLKIEDLTQRTAIVDRIGDCLAELNRVRSALKARVRDLLSGEMEADFASQTKLLDQAAAGALETADTPEKVDEALTRMMLQLEELEGRFAEFDELLGRLTEKRETLYEAFEARRQQLVEARSRRAEGLAAAAERILQGITSRALRLGDEDALRNYLVADPMVDKVRQIAGQLQELGDSVRMEDVLSRLKTVSDDALRQLRDRADLFTGGEGLIQLGKHQFSINRQPIELTTVVRRGQLQLHLTGTQFFQDMHDPALEQARDLWEQLLPSESAEVYRGEFLAAELYDAWGANHHFLALAPEKQVEEIRTWMQQRHDEGYSRGVHDTDAARILTFLLDSSHRLGLLRYAPEVRGPACYIWQALVPAAARAQVERWVGGYATIAQLLPTAPASERYVSRIRRLLARYGRGMLGAARLERAAHYLFEQLRQDPARIVASGRAMHAVHTLGEHLLSDDRRRFEEALAANRETPLAAWTLALDAVDGYLATLGRHQDAAHQYDPWVHYREEIAALLLLPPERFVLGSDAPAGKMLEKLAGDHPRVRGGTLVVNLHEFQSRLGRYRHEVLPRFKALRQSKHRLLEQAERRLRTHEFKARVLTSFVRNRLIDEVYLPLIGDNLAKQMGAAGDSKRSDRMGMLLLISPPGYGKTTLMEYIANRLGLVFVKVNGPALGHGITSLDPAEASNASAREEVQRINLALEMGDNVMLYLDDIQHCNPELLQKFIPLCDATRRIEGVWEGQPRTYDLRGRKVAVVMAGNPYTESGDRFQIPDMLANRADVYNLGEIIGDSREAFELSYIENCLTSNAVLQPLSRMSSRDQRAVIRAAERGTVEGLELEGNLGSDQVGEMISVLEKLLRARDIVLKINREYIRSAAQADAYRTEPPFKLQGSYRNMNRLAERVVAVMNDAELQSLISSNYEQDAQTLTRDSESNLLKFKELIGILTPAEAERWEQIQYAYVESVRMQGVDGEDRAAQVLRSLTGLRDGLEAIRRVIAQAISADQESDRQAALRDGLASVTSGMTALGLQVSGAIEDGLEGMRQAAAQPPEQKVLVQHSVPRVMTDLVRSQFQLLYDGLRPVLEAAALNNTQLERLRSSIDDCLTQYKAVQAEIDRAAQE
jgi:hypothetical protein